MNARWGTCLALGLLLAGCPGTKEKQVLAALAEGCNINSDCASPLVCAFRRCHAQCTSTRDCAMGLMCVPATPQPLKVCLLSDESKCVFNSDCVENLICGIDDRCRFDCVSDRDCLAGQSCASGTCADPSDLVDGGLVPVTDAGVPGAQSCVYNSDCTLPLSCRQGSCLPECRADRDCPAGRSCGNGICSGSQTIPDGGLGAGCLLNSDCNLPFICGPFSVCSYECKEARDCDQAAGYCCYGFQCRRGNVCGQLTTDGGVFDGGGGVTCLNDLSCDDNDFCNGIELCVGGLCQKPLHPICDDSNPCTFDMCNASTRTCSYASAGGDAGDQDGDGHFSFHCGGTADDCDDSNPNIYFGHPEECDFLDNNCDTHVDEGLWDERPGARIALNGTNDYGWWPGPPAVARVDGGWLIAVSSDAVAGSLDLFVIDDTLNLVQGPVPTIHSDSGFVHPANAPNVPAKRLLRPSLSVANGQTVVGGWVGTMRDATQCNPGSFWALSSQVAEVAGNLSGYTSWPNLGTDNGSTACTYGNPETIYPLYSTPRLAFDPRSNRWLAIWGARQGGAVDIEASYYQADGGLAASHSLLPVAADTAYNMFYAGAVEAPQMVVGPSNVLVAWNAASNGNYPTYVLMDDDLNSTVSTVFQITTSGTQIVSAGLLPGGYYLLLTNPSNVQQTLLIIDPQTGVQKAAHRLTDELRGNLMQPQSLGTDGTGVSAVLPLGTGVFYVSNVWPDFDIGYLSFANDGGIETTRVALNNTPRSAFALLPIDDRTVGMVWTDGELERTILECKP